MLGKKQGSSARSAAVAIRDVPNRGRFPGNSRQQAAGRTTCWGCGHRRHPQAPALACCCAVPWSPSSQSRSPARRRRPRPPVPRPRCGPAPAVTRPASLRKSCSACTSGTRHRRAGSLRWVQCWGSKLGAGALSGIAPGHSAGRQSRSFVLTIPPSGWRHQERRSVHPRDSASCSLHFSGRPPSLHDLWQAATQAASQLWQRPLHACWHLEF